ncbi:MAG: penicillin acylase family protein [Candidatus Poribacteria bacterium]|nr:penicillin acylase family protein [Candidatus Poribacteria bacterium]
MLRIIFTVVLLLLVIAVGGAIFVLVLIRASLPKLDGEARVPGLESPVKITSDRYGIPTIAAQSRLDATLALGYITARDRLWQIDILRRRAAGRLSEILGKGALGFDRSQRTVGFARAAKAIAANLPEDQKEILRSYASGINAYINAAKVLPFEFLILRYRPEPWTVEDSILVILNIFQDLTRHSEEDERMLSVMAASLPPEVAEFLTPDTDDYTTVLLGGKHSHRPIRPIPIEALASVRGASAPTGKSAGLVQIQPRVGSNNWAAAKSKTSGGRAMVANDMHLGLSVPNIWYRAALRYGDVEMSGVAMPGVPGVVAGSNGHVAWGFTNISGDFLDLVGLELNPENPEEYMTPAGWNRFEVVNETIRVKGGAAVEHPVKLTIWGPVSETALMRQPVAIHWTALEPQAVDIGLLHIDEADTLEDAIRVMNRSGGPPLNAAIADNTGRIAWTYCGRTPARKGFDGATSKSWADGKTGWLGYIPPEDLPRVIDPPAGFLVTANNRTLGKDYPHIIGHNYSNSYRAYRINERLSEMDQITEADMLQLQLDTTSRFYDFYQQLALSVLTNEALANAPDLIDVRRHIEAWNGKAAADSVSYGVLVHFHQRLATDVFTPFLARCKEVDENFVFTWRTIEPPLRMMLTEQVPELIPDTSYPNWEVWIRVKLEEVLQQLYREYHIIALDELTWGRINASDITHPLGRRIPVLGKYLNMAQDLQPGGTFCVRVTKPDFGASERFVVSPGRHEDGILHMPGGQSGHPLSRNYRDGHKHWVKGEVHAFLPGPPVHTLMLKPDLN